MARGRTIRKRRRRSSRAEAGAIEGAFWLLLVLAVAVGGARAASGLPKLAAMFLPGGISVAQADVQGPAARVVLPVHWHHGSSRFAPAVLVPVAAQGRPSWLMARMGAGAAPSQAPAIAIVMDDLGLDVAATRAAIALPRPVTLSFLPYGDATAMLARAGERVGHQVILHLPMEPEGTANPGPMALRVDLSASENIHRLDWALARVPGHAGLNNHMGSLFTQDRAALIPVMEHLAGRGLFFLDSRTTRRSVAVRLARAFGIMSAGRDVFLDDVQRRDYVDGQLAETQRIARRQGVAIAIGHPHAVTLAALKAWTAHVTARGFRLVPLRTAIRLKTVRDVMRMSALAPSRH